MKNKFLYLTVAIALAIGCAIPVSAEPSLEDSLGADFLDRLVFFGESTTTHLRQRSKIQAHRVWANDSCTARLDSNLASRPLRDEKTKAFLTPVELARRDQPPYLALSFGLNGIMEFSQSPEKYLEKYQKLIDAIKEASPDTRFLIQSVYPVARAELQADWNFSVSPREINERIDLLNRALSEGGCALSNAVFLDTSCNLKDSEGFLRAEFTTDGIHLSSDAYEVILRDLESAAREKITKTEKRIFS